MPLFIPKKQLFNVVLNGHYCLSTRKQFRWANGPYCKQLNYILTPSPVAAN